MFRIIYPVERNVTEKEIRQWLADAIANEEVDSIGGEYPNPQTVDIYYAIQLLNDSGKFTFAKEI